MYSFPSIRIYDVTRVLNTMAAFQRARLSDRLWWTVKKIQSRVTKYASSKQTRFLATISRNQRSWPVEEILGTQPNKFASYSRIFRFFDQNALIFSSRIRITELFSPCRNSQTKCRFAAELSRRYVIHLNASVDYSAPLDTLRILYGTVSRITSNSARAMLGLIRSAIRCKSVFDRCLTSATVVYAKRRSRKNRELLAVPRAYARKCTYAKLSASTAISQHCRL